MRSVSLSNSQIREITLLEDFSWYVILSIHTLYNVLFTNRPLGINVSGISRMLLEQVTGAAPAVCLYKYNRNFS